MIFTTYWFICAVTGFLLTYFLVRNPLARKILLLIFCIIFHGHFAGAAGAIPVCVVGLIVYIAGYSQKKLAMYFAIALSIAALVWYKYTGFIALQVLSLFDADLAASANVWALSKLPEAPPLAISFFTFEFVHYLYDVLKGKKPIRNFLDFWNFTLFFPTLVAGPIKRFENFLPALDHGLMHTRKEDVSAGLVQISVGITKKVLIADNLSPYIDYLYPKFFSLSFVEKWFFVVLISLRILMDFSGYSDIAIGLARVMGVSIPANFNWPYLATNIRDFWQRWHISLSSWIRDYIYIPLGGNRRGATRTILNGIFAFALCGLWHGPTWSFIFWGLYHGFGLAISSQYSKLGPGGKWLHGVFRQVPMLSWLVTMIFVGIGWVYFFYELHSANKMVIALLGMN